MINKTEISNRTISIREKQKQTNRRESENKVSDNTPGAWIDTDVTLTLAGMHQTSFFAIESLTEINAPR